MPPAGKLHADRKTAGAVAAVQRDRRLLAHVERQRESDVLERPRGVVQRAGELGGEADDGAHRREHEVEALRRGDGGIADRAHLAVASEHLFAAQCRAARGPLVDVGQHLRLALLRPGADVQPRAHAPEGVEAVDHRARGERRERLDDRAGLLEGARSSGDRGDHVGLRGHAPAGVEPEADLQAAHGTHSDVEIVPRDVLRRQAHRVARIRLGEHAHCQRGVLHRACDRPGDTAGVRRIDRDAAQARLHADDAAPACRQTDRPSDVGAEVQRAITGRTRSRRAGAAAAGVLRQVPRVARQRVKARQAGRQHAEVGHRRLGDDHRAGFAQSRRRWRVGCGRHEQGRRAAERHRHAARGDVLLDRHRHTVERQRFIALPARLTRSRGGECGIGVLRPQRRDLRFAALDVVEQVVADLDRRDLAARVER